MTWLLGRPGAFAIATMPLFDADECRRIMEMAEAQAGWSSAGVYRGGGGDGVDLHTRSVRSTPVPSRPDAFPMRRLIEGLAAVNDERYRYRLDSIPPGDYPTVLRYDGSTADHFRAHRDVDDFAPTRKLTFTVQLSDPADYVGCDLVFTNTGTLGDRTQGALITFPSYEMHHVTPVTTGTRYAIVGWVHGSTYA